MRIPLRCMKCVVLDVQNGRRAGDQQYSAVLLESGLYEFSCLAGHRSSVLLEEQKFELLYEMGLHAIVDGYYHQAVVSFAAALERYYEFYCRVIAQASGNDLDAFDALWRRDISRSERQAGAYAMAYYLENKVGPAELKPAWVQFRNSVVHNGKIPGRAKAIEFGQATMDLIVPSLLDTKARYGAAIQEVIRRHVLQIAKARPADVMASYLSVGTAISVTERSNSPQEKIETFLSIVEASRKLPTISLPTLP